MFAPSRLAALVIATAILAPSAWSSADDFTAPLSRTPTLLNLCDENVAGITPAACKQNGYDALAAQLDKAIQAALAKAPANVRPLLMRDQAWFYEIVVLAQQLAQSDNAEDRKPFDDMLRERVHRLARIEAGFGRSGVLGTWEDAFGSVTVTPADDGAYRLAIDARPNYGSDERRWTCRATAVVKDAPGGWLTGTIVVEEPRPPLTTGEIKTARGPLPPPLPQPIKMRRQGQTLRIVVGAQTDDRHDGRPSCPYGDQITASYFAAGKSDLVTAHDKVATEFVAPTFDCAHPVTSSDEEICADPDLADNDQRQNRAWKTLLPRLDEATRRMLTADQRHWVQAQAMQYPEFLHPAWNKRTSEMHFTEAARDQLNALQRERIALLEGFDDKRIGLAGLWVSYTAILEVKPTDDGKLTAQGWKWQQGDWKGGCDYDMTGKVVNGTFRSDEKRKNPDTLERDHASLIVNRLDDVFAEKRDGDDDNDMQKCKRNYTLSSTVRLFPVRPSPDIDGNESSTSIR